MAEVGAGVATVAAAAIGVTSPGGGGEKRTCHVEGDGSIFLGGLNYLGGRGVLVMVAVGSDLAINLFSVHVL